jgi:dTDP-4-amino-4,6-dideoxygalactose transaminase
MAVPFIDLKRFEPGLLDEWQSIIAEVSANTQFIAGPQAAQLEKALAEESGAAEVVACANGTDALQLALRASGVGESDVVLVPDSTFWATFEAVVNVGARAVTVDVAQDDLQMDFELFCQAVEKYRPKAALLVHLYGWGTSQLNEFRQYAQEHDVILIEDAAQAYGVTYQGESIYKDAQISTVSFYVAKVLGASGDAGAVYCSSAEQAKVVRQLGNHGRTHHYEHGLVGWNSRIGGIDAAWLNLAHKHIESRLESRREATRFYQKRLSEIGICTMSPPDSYVENGYLNVCMIEPEHRPKVEAHLKEHGIGFGIVYPIPVSQQPGSTKYLEGKVGGEVADRVCRSVISLPLFAYITQDELDEVCRVMEAALPLLQG